MTTVSSPQQRRTAAARLARKEISARRALADPKAVERAARIVRHALAAGLLTAADVDPGRAAQ